MNEPFKIFRVNSDVVKELAKAPNQAHSHNYEEIMVVIKGTIEHVIDFESKLLEAPFVSFITKGKVHRVKPVNNGQHSDGFVIRFQSEFVSETIFQLYHFYHDNANVFFSSNREFERFVTLCEILNEETKQGVVNYSIIRSLLSTLLTILEAEKSKSYNNYKINHPDSPFIKFLQLLEENFHQPVGVPFYAEKLFMSSRNLNLICKKILQKSVSEMIQTRRLMEAKHLLATTNKSINEIGFEIGYQEKAYFSNIFKKKTGQTPSNFRKEIKKLTS